MTKKFTIKEKQTSVDRYLSGESVTLIADELGISKSTLYNWIKKFKPVSEKKKFTAKDFNNLEQRTNRQYDMIEILKTVECNAQSPLQEKLCEIEKLYGKYSVHVLCDALNVPRGTFIIISNATSVIMFGIKSDVNISVLKSKESLKKTIRFSEQEKSPLF